MRWGREYLTAVFLPDQFDFVVYTYFQNWPLKNPYPFLDSSVCIKLQITLFLFYFGEGGGGGVGFNISFV